MKARDVMTSAVVSVGPDRPMSEIAKLLRDHKISAVPVVDATGTPSGMISEGDLTGRGETTSNAPNPIRQASEIMAAPVITVGEETEVAEIARLLIAHRIKRVPVLRDGRIVGIVSRADLIRALAAEKPKPAADGDGVLAEAFAGLDRHFFHRQSAADQPAPLAPPPAASDAGLTASDFRGLIADHEHKKLQHSQELGRTAAEQRRKRVAELINRHISDENWRSLLHKARQSAEQGEKEFMLLRFPSQLCSDRGRTINSAGTAWSETLRGEAGELYLRWEHDLKSLGFQLGARILDFPGGMPGDIGLFLRWGQ
jgi:CBS domain-containing protein